MLRSWLGCIIALAVLVGFSFADDAISGYAEYCGEFIAGYTIYVRCTDHEPPHQVEAYIEDYMFRVSCDGESDVTLPHVGYWKVKAYKWDVGISGWCSAHYLGQQGQNHYYEVLYLIPLPKK